MTTVDRPSDGSRVIHTEDDSIYLRYHDVAAPDLHRLYENAKRDQWNVTTDIDWEQPVNLDEGFVADELIDIYSSSFWNKMNSKEKAEMNRLFSAWRLSQLLHGEHGAVLVCGQLANVLPDADTKFFMATQVMDEARHNEFFQRYLTERVGQTYDQADTGRELFDFILADSRWYIKTIGLQLIGETFAVALFKMLADTAKDELLREGCKLILRDEARHMGFGMLSLPEQVAQMSAQELAEVEEFTVYFLRNTLTGGFPKEAYLDMGFNKTEIQEIRDLRKQKAQGNDFTMFRQLFKRDMHHTLVNNLYRCGILSENMKGRLEEELRVNVAEHLAAD
ncbi:MAG TPA: ferritin-like domain-containing protein [Dehalococcoidia bacterium]|jgi:rubrerythrin|nr:ferritin-like domain-containing protein [Dehalococcoidia bacterium]